MQDLLADFPVIEPWSGEVLGRLGLYQRRIIIGELGNMRSVRNPTGLLMSKVRNRTTVDERVAIFIDVNDLDRGTEERLWDLTDEQKELVMFPGMVLQNVRDMSYVVRSRITKVLQGRDALGREISHQASGSSRHHGGTRNGKGGKGGGKQDRSERGAERTSREKRSGSSSSCSSNRSDRSRGRRQVRKRSRLGDISVQDY